MNMKLECPTCRSRLPRIDAYENLGSDSNSDSDLESIEIRQWTIVLGSIRIWL